MKNKADDYTVEEIRRHRKAHAESFDHDLKRITEELQRQEQESGVPVVRRASCGPQVCAPGTP